MSTSNLKYAFNGKVALVTGSSAGIGKAIAIQLAQYGAKVTITGRNDAALKSVAAQIEQVSGGDSPLQIVGDLLDESLPKKLIDETIKKYGRLDFLINNAGGATPNGTYSSPNLLDEYDRVMKLNVRSVISLTQLSVPHLEKFKGNIVNISSIAAIKPFQPIYSISKAALDMVTKTSALELGPKGIRVNSVNPGPVVTDFLRSRNVDKEGRDRFYEEAEPNSLMKRIGRPEDIANLVSFLVSDDAMNITGSIMVSDSGTLIGPGGKPFKPDMYEKK
ncbi:hypothetical protein RDWZM_008397 [Blomia tropicalis]|uniref:Uncharacterized protein n=1 Tax=Blomia tropicalis TaxID=40697 RepID=A0A9Q0RKB1_BLOTA|nr:hypothetical protein RDWZM_008397 [Blomia tropicalis]